MGHGDRVALLSENRLEVLELFLAAAQLGAIVACQNWRLAPPSWPTACGWSTPAVTVASPRYCQRQLRRAPLVLGDDYEAQLAAASAEPCRPTPSTRKIRC